MKRFGRSYLLALMVAGTLATPGLASAAPILFEGQLVALSHETALGPPVVPDTIVLVGPGIEAPGGDAVSLSYATNISDTNILLNLFSEGAFGVFPFVGLILSDVNGTIAAIASVAVNSSTNVSGFTASRITFDANNVWLNLQGLAVNNESIVSVDVTPAAVPEPTSLLLLGTGIAGLAAKARRLRKQRAAR